MCVVMSLGWKCPLYYELRTRLGVCWMTLLGLVMTWLPVSEVAVRLGKTGLLLVTVISLLI